MSASEKLKAMTEGQWLVSDETIAKALAPVLPELIAVVEAADALRGLEKPSADDLVFAMADIYMTVSDLDKALQ